MAKPDGGQGRSQALRAGRLSTRDRRSARRIPKTGSGRRMSKNWRPLHVALRNALGSAVRFDTAQKSVYASDASNYRQVPIGVVVPRSLEQVVEGVAICHENRVPLLVRGAGTSMSGQTVNEAVVFDLSTSCNRIVEIDPAAKTALVEPGVVCDSLRAAAERHGLTFAPDPSTTRRCP